MREAEALLERGKAALALEHHDDATSDLRHALEIAQGVPYPLLQGRALIQLGLVAQATGDLDEARTRRQEAADVLAPMPVTENAQVAKLLEHLGGPAASGEISDEPS